MTDVNKCCELFMEMPEQVGWRSVDECVQKWDMMGKDTFNKGCACLQKGKRDNAYVECVTGTEGALLKERTGGSTNESFVKEIEAQLAGDSHVKYGSCMHNGTCYQYEINAGFIEGGRDVQPSCTQPAGKDVKTCSTPNDPDARAAVSQCKIPCHKDKYVSDMYTNTWWPVIVAMGIATMLVGSLIAFRRPLRRVLKHSSKQN
jgi:hypothetical protein